MAQQPGSDRVHLRRSNEPQWETREFTLPRGVGREAARQLLTANADQGNWELARLQLYPDGHRKVWLRRRIYRIDRPA